MPDDNPHDGETVEQYKARLAGEAASAKAEAEAAQREMAFLRAGVDVQTPQGALFAKGYDGELSAEAIQTQFREVFGEPEQPPTAESVPVPDGMDMNDPAVREFVAAQQGQQFVQAPAPGSSMNMGEVEILDSPEVLAALSQEAQLSGGIDMTSAPVEARKIAADIRAAGAKGDMVGMTELLNAQGIAVEGAIPA